MFLRLGVCIGILAAVCSAGIADAQWRVVFRDDFTGEKVGEKPANWKLWVDKADQGALAVADEGGLSTPAMQLDNLKRGFGSTCATLRFLPVLGGHRLRVRFKAATRDMAGYARAIIQVRGVDGKNCAQRKTIVIDPASRGWRDFEAVYKAPGPADTVYLFFTIKDRGRLWVDAIEVAVELDNLIVNGDVEVAEADGSSSGWALHLFKNMETLATMARVADADKGGHVLALRYASGARRFGARAAVARDLAPGRRYEAAVMAKTDGKGRARLGALMLDGSGRPTGPLATSDEVTATAWSPIVWRFDAPLEAKTIALLLLNTGAGEVRFDEARLEDAGLLPPATEADDIPLHAVCDPADGNKHWNGGRSVFHTLLDSPVGLSFQIYGDKKKLEEPGLVIEVPDELAIAEVHALGSERYKLKSVKPEIKTEPVERNGRRYTRHTVSAELVWNAVDKVPHSSPRFVAAFRPVSGQAGGEYTVYWHLVNNHMHSRNSEILVKVLPPLPKSPNPQGFPLLHWQLIDVFFHDAKLLDQTLSRFEEINTRGCIFERTSSDSHVNRVQQTMRERGWSMMCTVTYTNPLSMPDTWMPRTIKMKRAVGPDGKPIDDRRCPHYILNDSDFGREYKRFMTAHVAKLRQGELSWIDFEPFGYTKRLCFCDECLDDFAKHIGLSRAQLGPRGEILATHGDRWVAFWADRFTAVVKLAADLAREVNPGCPIAIYDYAWEVDKPRRLKYQLAGCPLDAVRVDAVVDIHGLSFYSLNGKEAFDRIDVNRRALKKKVLMMPSLSRPHGTMGGYTSEEAAISPHTMRAKLIYAAASGCDGINFYPGWGIDGMYFVTINRALAEIAAVEAFYTRGRRVDETVTASVPNYPDGARFVRERLGLRAHRLDGKTLVTVFNFDDAATVGARLSIAGLAPGRYRVGDPTASGGGKRVTCRDLAEGITLPVAAEDVAFVLIEPEK